MPEAIAGAAVQTRDAAAVVLTRDLGKGLELFWVRRAMHLSFSPGYWALPGGSVEPQDARVEVAGLRDGHAPLVAAAARELFEETGVLMARGSPRPDAAKLQALRRMLLAHERSFAEVLAQTGTRLDARDFVPAGQWITPEYLPIRFNARFFLAALPEGAQAEVWEGELVEGGWVAPRDVLERWLQGEAVLQPPLLNALQACAGPADLRLARLRAPDFAPNGICERIELQRGVVAFALESPALPPARHTGCYLLGNGELLVVDPGSPSPAEQARLLRFIERLEAEGRRPIAVVVTHAHPDHASGAHALKHALGIPLWAHAACSAGLAGIDRFLTDGETLTLRGEPPMRLQVLHTPGHARGHICLFEPRTRALFCGDMVSAASTVVIDPPDGDMTDYLASLARLARLSPALLYPGHGDVILDGTSKLQELLRHRAWREEQVLAALGASPRPLAAITRQAYGELPEALFLLAERSTLACLVKLVREGRAAVHEESFLLPIRENLPCVSPKT